MTFNIYDLVIYFFEIVRGVKRDQMNKVLGIGKQRTILSEWVGSCLT